MKIKSGFYYSIFLSVLMMLNCSPTADRILKLHTAELPAVIFPDEEIEIVKVDSRMVDIKHRGELGSQYAGIAISPGIHRIIVNLVFFDEGSVFYLWVDLVGGHQYAVKYNITDRVSGLKWQGGVWVEDLATGEIVSKIERNI